MGTGGRSFAFASVLVFFVSGCLGATTEDGRLQSQPTASRAIYAPAEFDDVTGAIEGVVIDEETVPIEGAEVTLIDAGSVAVTDVAGRFAFSKVEAATYKVHVGPLGFESTIRRVEVTVGHVSELRIVLRRIDVAQPYYVPFVDDFVVACRIIVGPFYPAYCGTLNTASPGIVEDKALSKHGSVANLVGVVAALSWSPNQGFVGARYISLAVASDRDLAGAFNNATRGHSPIVNRFVLEAPLGAKNNISTSATVLGYCTTSTPNDCLANPPETLVQFVFQQRFKAYTTLFYGDPPPVDYTGLPDG